MVEVATVIAAVIDWVVLWVVPVVQLGQGRYCFRFDVDDSGKEDVLCLELPRVSGSTVPMKVSRHDPLRTRILSFGLCPPS